MTDLFYSRAFFRAVAVVVVGLCAYAQWVTCGWVTLQRRGIDGHNLARLVLFLRGALPMISLRTLLPAKCAVVSTLGLLALSLIAADHLGSLPATAQDSDKDKALALDLIQKKKYREALNELVKAVGSEPENPTIYSTLSGLYRQIKECSLAWKYYEVSKDLRHDDLDLRLSLEKLCKEPIEQEYKESPELLKGKLTEGGEVDAQSAGTLLFIAFSPEQSEWSSHAKLPLIGKKVDGFYWELNLAQMRKVRALTGVTVPWIIIGTGGEKRAKYPATLKIAGDGWGMLMTTFPAPLTQP
jgi:hypothetical protein